MMIQNQEKQNDPVLCLVATKECQGDRRNDFFWAEEGEVVYLGTTCDGATPDDKCGCARSFSGVKSFKATTTARVTRLDRKKLIEDRAAFYEKAWRMAPDEARHEAIGDVQNMAITLKPFKIGNIVEIRGEIMRARNGGQ